MHCNGCRYLRANPWSVAPNEACVQIKSRRGQPTPPMVCNLPIPFLAGQSRLPPGRCRGGEGACGEGWDERKERRNAYQAYWSNIASSLGAEYIFADITSAASQRKGANKRATVAHLMSVAIKSTIDRNQSFTHPHIEDASWESARDMALKTTCFNPSLETAASVGFDSKAAVASGWNNTSAHSFVRTNLNQFRSSVYLCQWKPRRRPHPPSNPEGTRPIPNPKHGDSPGRGS